MEPLQRALLLCLTAIFFSSCYMSRQVYQQGLRLMSRQDAGAVYADPATSQEVKIGLEWLTRILEYARHEGLNVENAYRKVVMLDEDAVSYTVQAAYHDRLEAVTWWFPIVGRVPYLGFVDKQERDAQAVELEAMGYDVAKGRAAAFSSLGWFEDPVFSPMLHRSIEHLANLIFHELVHRTFWSSGSVLFNEQLASFCAHRLTLRFLAMHGLTNRIDHYLRWLRDRKKFRDWLASLRGELKKLYAQTLPTSSLRAKKLAIFDNYLRKHRPDFEAIDFVGNLPWNNARVIGASLYSPNRDRFAAAFACSKSFTVGEFLSAIEGLEVSLESSKQLKKLLCRADHNRHEEAS